MIENVFLIDVDETFKDIIKDNMIISQLASSRSITVNIY